MAVPVDNVIMFPDGVRDSTPDFGRSQTLVKARDLMADEGAPFMRADAQALVGEQAPIGGGDFRHAALVAIAALDQAVDARLLKSMRAEEFNHGADRVAGDLLHHHLRREVFALGDPQPGAGLLFQPCRQAEVVGVAVGDDDARQAPLCERRLPGLLYRLLGEAGIHRRIAVAVGQEPGVDVVQGKRQRHAKPLHAGHKRHRHAGGGRSFVGIGDGSVQAVSLCILKGNLLKLAAGDLPFYPNFSALCAVQQLPPAASRHERGFQKKIQGDRHTQGRYRHFADST